MTANWGSSGRIAEQIGDIAQKINWDSYIVYGRYANDSKSNLIKIGSRFAIYNNALAARLFDCEGLTAKRSTLQLIKRLQEVKPDIIHLHNIHGYYINYPILFSFLKDYKAPVVWTLHDCWPFTGHCSYFDLAECVKWKTECNHCPQKGEYPKSYMDFSHRNFNLKKEVFTSCNNLTIVPVSYWLENLVKESFWKGYKTKMIHNGIDTDMFSVRNNANEMWAKYGITAKYVILGVASPFNKRKGYPDFISLSHMLPEEYCIVMVGLNAEQKKNLPGNIIGIERTQDVSELASLYSCADVFVNLTYEDNFPTTNLEAMACGTPVITYNTGGSPEAVDADTGIVVPKGDLVSAKDAIVSVCGKGKSFYSQKCRFRAERHFNKDDCFRKYIDLYNSMLNK